MNKAIEVALAAGTLLGTSLGAQAQDYVLTTASTGGTFHPVGVALSTLTKIKLLPEEGFSLTAVNSAGSGANLQAMASGTSEFSILQGIFGVYAAEGSGPLEEPQDNLRSISMLWQNVEHFVIDNDLAETGTMADVVAAKGKGAGMGAMNSGTLGSNKALLDGLDLDVESDFDLIYAGYGPTAEALANGQIALASLPAGVPAGAVTQLLATNAEDVTLLEVTDEELEQMDGGRGLWTRYVIPADSYPGQEEELRTIAQPNFLAVNADVPQEHVYKLTKAIYENLPFLQSIHPATEVMSLDAAVAGLPVPLHPGAVQYYEEVGLEIPDHLIPEGAE